MIRSPLRLLAALALVALTLFVVACGGDDDERSGDSGKSNGSPAEGKKGGKLEQLGASDVDFLDPGQTYYTAGFQVVYATQTAALRPQAGRRRRRTSPRSPRASRRSPTTRRRSR